MNASDLLALALWWDSRRQVHADAGRDREALAALRAGEYWLRRYEGAAS